MNRKAFTFLIPIVIVFSFFFLYPLVILVMTSIKGVEGEFTLINYTQMLTNSYYSKALINSVVLSIAVTIFSLIIGGFLAFFLARTEFPGKTLYFTMLTFPMSFPGVVVGFMIIILFGSTGVVPNLMNIITGESSMALAYTLSGIFLAYLYFQIPRVIMTLYGAIVEFDGSLEEAARTTGATQFQSIRYVVLPTLFPIFISAGALAFSTSMSAFGTVFTLANQFQILPILMYNEFTLSFNIEVASAIAIIVGIVTVFMNLASRMILERGEG